jgi:hypothetical protein
MGGIGVVKDWKKFDAWIDKLQSMSGIDKYEIPKIANLNSWDVNIDGAGHYSVTLPVNSEPTVTVSKTKAESVSDDVPDWYKAKKLLTDGEFGNVVMFSFGNDEGDSSFWDGNDYDYDIDLSTFDAAQQEIYNGFSEENGIIFVDKQYGAGRNG